MLTGGCEQYCTIEEENLELEDSINFLGSSIDRNCDYKKEVHRRTMIGRTAMIGLAKIWTIFNCNQERDDGSVHIRSCDASI